MTSPSLEGTRVAVTGAAKLVGCHLCELFIRSAACVLGIDNLSTGSRASLSSLDGHRSFTFRHHDVTMPAAIDGAINAIKPRRQAEAVA